MTTSFPPDEEITLMYRNPVPIEKIYEAWSAIADGRVRIAPDSNADEGQAEVISSSGEKTYLIKWADGGKVFSSTDNASFWRGYPGYPIIAVLMALGRLPYSEDTALQYKNVNWTEINKARKGKYAEALADVENDRNIDSEANRSEALKTYDALLALGITVRRKI